jgi:hypothetical protein
LASLVLPSLLQPSILPPWGPLPPPLLIKKSIVSGSFKKKYNRQNGVSPSKSLRRQEMSTMKLPFQRPHLQSAAALRPPNGLSLSINSVLRHLPEVFFLPYNVQNPTKDLPITQKTFAIHTHSQTRSNISFQNVHHFRYCFHRCRHRCRCCHHSCCPSAAFPSRSNMLGQWEPRGALNCPRWNWSSRWISFTCRHGTSTLPCSGRMCGQQPSGTWRE